METAIHDVESTQLLEMTNHDDFWTRELVVTTKEGNKFTLTLFTKGKDKGGIEVIL